MELLTISRLMVLCLCTGLSAWWDMKKGRIPNFIVYSGIIAGILTCAEHQRLFGILLALCFIFLFGMLRLMGMGDIKLWMAITALSDFFTGCMIIIAGEILLILYAIWTDRKQSLQVLSITIRSLIYSRKIITFEQKGYPLAPFLFVPSVAYAILRGIHMLF